MLLVDLASYLLVGFLWLLQLRAEAEGSVVEREERRVSALVPSSEQMTSLLPRTEQSVLRLTPSELEAHLRGRKGAVH